MGVMEGEWGGEVGDEGGDRVVGGGGKGVEG